MKIVLNGNGGYQIKFGPRDIKKIVKKHGQAFADMQGRMSLCESEKDRKPFKVQARGTFRFFKQAKEIKVEFSYAKVFEDVKMRGVLKYKKGDIVFLNALSEIKITPFKDLYSLRIKDKLFEHFKGKVKGPDWTEKMKNLRAEVLKKGTG